MNEMIPTSAAASAVAHEQQDLRAVDRNADVAGRVLLAADGEDPVSERGPAEDPRADDRHPDEPQDRGRVAARKRAAREERAAEYRLGAAQSGRMRAGDRDLRAPAVEQQHAAGARAAQDEERRQRDDEARQLRQHDDVAVDQPDRGGEHERDRRSRARCPRATCRPAAPSRSRSRRSSRPPRGRTRRRSSAGRPAPRRSRRTPPAASKPRSRSASATDDSSSNR